MYLGNAIQYQFETPSMPMTSTCLPRWVSGVTVTRLGVRGVGSLLADLTLLLVPCYRYIMARKSMHPKPTEPALYGDRRRVVFVTGAAQGIGKAIALRLARDGLDVAVNDLKLQDLESVKDEIEKLGGALRCCCWGRDERDSCGSDGG